MATPFFKKVRTFCHRRIAFAVFPGEANADRDCTGSPDSVREPSTQSCTERQEDQRVGQPVMAMLFKKPASNGLGQAPNQHRDIRQRSRKLSQVSTCPLSIIARLVPLNAKGGRYAPRRRDERPFHKRLQCHLYLLPAEASPHQHPLHYRSKASKTIR